MCIKILVGFDCLLCTGKLLQLKIADSMINDQLTLATVNWADTKGEKCTGITNSVNVTNTVLIRLLARFIQTKQPDDSIIAQLPQASRSSFRQLADGLLSQQLTSKTL